MNSIPGNIPVLFLVILGASLAWSLPINPDQDQKDLKPVGQQFNQMANSDAESEFIERIPPRGQHSSEEEKAQYDVVTLLDMLESAGVTSADNRELHSLSYGELIRLLALWKMSQDRNVYVAKGPEVQPDQAIDIDSDAR
ncbi:uncharacterized protein LOC119558246 [Drosophila subpulchrella]|uniref:uncharacterized protein LOC119558246 n=1 Tax=Drosophila subpulchrella TaxID=1486046 RepID=UPI0018A167AE|nr:uncharacterized protein LOC119558246 [Drosophila subpulchrella]